MTTITGTRIDQVLQDAVESGAVPNVVATAANADGPIYEGAAGPRAVGESDPVTVDTMFRIASMTKMVTTTAALQLVEQGKLDLDAPVENYRPEFADLQVLEGFDGDDAAAARAEEQGHGAPARHATRPGWLLVLERGHRALGGGDGHAATSLAGARGDLHGAAGRRPRHEVRVRHQHGLARPGGRGGERPDAGRVLRRAHPRPARHGASDLPSERRAARRTSSPVHLRGERRRVGGDRASTGRRAGLVGRRPRALLPAARVPALPADAARAAARSTARRSSGPRRSTTAFTQPDRRPRLPGRRSRPPSRRSSADFNAGPGYKFGLGLLLNDARTCRACARAGSGAWAGIFNTHFWVDRDTGVTGAIYTQTLPFVEPAVFQVYIDFETGAVRRACESGPARGESRGRGEPRRASDGRTRAPRTRA